jgi:hypothetical protein
MIIQRNEAGELTVTAVRGDDYTEGQIWLEPDARRVVIGLSVSLSRGVLGFGGGLSPDQNVLDGRCTLEEREVPCSLIRRGATVTPASPLPIPGARVAWLQFYEGPFAGDPPTNERQYATQFSSTSSRKISFDLRLEHPAPAERIYFDLDAVWFRADGSVLTRQVGRSFADAGWGTSNHWRGFGAANPGAWAPGRYRVEVSSGGTELASGAFEVFPGEESETPPGARTCEIQKNPDPADGNAPGSVFSSIADGRPRHLIVLVVGNPHQGATRPWAPGRAPEENYIEGRPPQMVHMRELDQIIGPPGRKEFRHAVEVAEEECAKWRAQPRA